MVNGVLTVEDDCLPPTSIVLVNSVSTRGGRHSRRPLQSGGAVDD